MRLFSKDYAYLAIISGLFMKGLSDVDTSHKDFTFL